MTQSWDAFPTAPAAPSQPVIPRAPSPRAADEVEHQALSNEALRQQIEQDNQRLDPATVDMIAHQYILAGPSALSNVAGRGRAGQANRDAILNRASQIAGVRSGENVQVGFARYRNGSHAIQNLENQMGTISTNEQNASGAAEQLLTAIRQVYPANSTRPGNIARGIYRDIFNDPAMATFDTARNTFLTEYAKVVAGSPSGSGVLSDSARHEQQENLSRATSPEAAQAAIDQMRRDMAIRLDAFHTNIQRGYTNLENGQPVAFHPNGDLVDEHGRVVPLGRDREALPASGTSGPQPPAPSTPPNTPPSPDPNFAQNLASAEPGSYARFQALEQYHNVQQHGGGAVSTIGFGDQPESEWRDSFGQTQAQAHNLEAEYQAQLPHWTQARQVAQQTSAAAGGDPAYEQRARMGFTQGLNDELSGAGRAVGNAIQAPFAGGFDPSGSYQMGRDAERIRNSQAQDATGGLGTALEVGSSIIGSAPLFGVAAPAEGAGLGGRMIAGARAGLPAGAVSGWAHGEGLEGSTIGAVEGGVGGAALGTAAPVLGSLARGGGRLARGAYRLARGENPELAPRTVAQAFTDDANTAGGVGTQMAEAHANDVPMMAADTGDNARGMLAATSRAPGLARTLTRDALRQRQEGLPERVTAAIERDLGPASNPHEVADQLSQQARTAAAPLYASAYARPGADTFAQRMSNMFSRPSMQGALQRASRIAAEEGRDPNTLGFNINSSGETTVGPTPSWQTLDYVKRGLDDVVEQYRDPVTGKLNLNTEGNAVNSTLRNFLSEMDQANPDYAAARAAYSGPTRGAAAMQQGLRSLNLTADDMSARINRMTPFEQDMFRLGHRRAMVEHVAGRADQADMVNALIGTGKRRAAIQRLYGDNENFPRFVSTLQAEQAGHQTFREAMLGSQTAPNIQNDAALPGAATAALTDMATTGGLPVASGIRQVVKMGQTRVGRNAQQQISTLLSENDPANISELARVLRARAAQSAAAQAAAGQRAGAYGVIGGNLAGQSIQDAYGP